MNSQTSRQAVGLVSTVLAVSGLFLLLGTGIAAAGHENGAHAGFNANCDDGNGNGGEYHVRYSDGSSDGGGENPVEMFTFFLQETAENQYPSCGDGQQSQEHTGGDYEYAEGYVHTDEGVGAQACYSEDNQEQPTQMVSASENEDACRNNFERPEDRENP